MDAETQEKLEQKKRYITDYLEMAKRLGIDTATQQKTIDLLLDDISRLLRKSEE